MSSDAMGTGRKAVLDEARRWIGTPYRHQASCRGAGSDCLGLLRGIWRALYGAEPQALPPYSADWAETGGRETLLEAGRRWLLEIAPEATEPGDVLVFRWRDGMPAKHVGILSAPLQDAPRLIHAYERVGVIESPLVPSWQRRIAASFTFPKETV
ncbi:MULTISPECIES: peptidase P60 [unclassified Labrenzia]|uniref:peptidase P60 n=1 Tax=unclassified Labrenzia TaxID=2648686 RepID=UPI00336BC0BA